MVCSASTQLLITCSITAYACHVATLRPQAHRLTALIITSAMVAVIPGRKCTKGIFVWDVEIESPKNHHPEDASKHYEVTFARSKKP